MMFSDRLHKLMYEKDITQIELSIMADTTEATISRYLSKQRVLEENKTVMILCNIAKALNVTVDSLLGIEKAELKTANADARLLDCYNKASDKEKKAIWYILEEYSKVDVD